jgi:hypothetical protein
MVLDKLKHALHLLRKNGHEEAADFFQQEVMEAGLGWLRAREVFGLLLQQLENMEKRIMADLTQLNATVSKLADDVQANFDAVEALVQKALNTSPDDTAGVQSVNDALAALSAKIEQATADAKAAVAPPAEPPPGT